MNPLFFQAGDEVGPYRIQARVGGGSQAVVYRVEKDGDLFALKVLLSNDRDLFRRMLREGDAQRAVVHPNVVRVHELLDLGDVPALVQDFVDGVGLDQWLEGRGNLPLDEALGVFRGILGGVGAAHAAGLIHRDLKLANVLVELQGGTWIPRVTDFGLVKDLVSEDVTDTRTKPGSTMGSPKYIAPEQVLDASTVDLRADLFSLGAILYEMVCGRPAFRGDTQYAVLMAVKHGDYARPLQVRPELPPALVEVIEHLLQTDPDDRPRRASDVELALYGTETIPAPADRTRRSFVDLDLYADEPRMHATPALPRRRPEPPQVRSWPALAAGMVVMFAVGLSLSLVVAGWLQR